MKKPASRDVLRLVVSLALALGVPAGTAVFFRAEGPLAAIFAAAAVCDLLFLLRLLAARRTGVRFALTALLVLVYALSAVALVVYIIVIPFSYYLAWLDVVASLRFGGIISFLFVAVSAWFASLCGGLAFSAGPARPAAGAVLVVLFELAVVFRIPLTVALFTGGLALALILLALAGKKPSLHRLVLPLSLLAVAAGAGALFALDNPPNAGALTKTSLLSDVKAAIVRVFPDLSALSSVAGYGFSFEKSDLGRRPVLSRLPLLRVRTRERRVVYVRTQVYDDYYNNNWAVGRYFADRMRWGKADIPAAGPPGDDEVRVTVLFDYFPSLPLTLDADAVSIRADPPAVIAAGNFDSGFELARPLLKGAEVVVAAAPYFRPAGAAAALEPFAGRAPDAGFEARAARPGEETEDLLARYRVVPSSITPRIRALAAALKGAETSPWNILANIGAFLGKGYVYSLDTTVPPDGEEFLDDFLFVTKRGFCVHFATAFAVLARLDGVPARYATGFLAFLPPGGEGIVVSGLNAHAWPEAWLPGAGWVALEATPAFDPAGALLPDYYRRFNSLADEQTASQLEALMGGRIPVPSAPETGSAGFFARLAPAWPWAAAFLLLATVAVAVAAFVKRSRSRRRTYKGNLARFNRRLRLIVTRLERRAVASPESAGWTAWGETVRALVPAERRHVRTLVRLANRVFFARAPVAAADLRFVRGLSRRLARRLRERRPVNELRG
jgi:transglutaminase-like putative cysteine protease